MAALPGQSEKVRAGLEEIRLQADELQLALLEMMKADDGNLFPMDLLVIGAGKRHASMAAAVSQLVEAWNMVAVRALLRMQIDTALRLSVAWVMESPNDFAKRVLGGERIDRMKDPEGKPLTDARLVERHTKAFPWLPVVYERLSGYVHFSDSHIFAPMKVTGDHAYETTVGPADLEFPESSWLEITGCFLEVSTAILVRVRLWTEWKNARALAIKSESPPPESPP